MIATNNDLRALVAELVAIFDTYDDESNLAGIYDDMKANGNTVLERVRVALAETEPEGPTDFQIDARYPMTDFRDLCAELAEDVRYLTECLRNPSHRVDALCLSDAEDDYRRAHTALAQTGEEELTYVVLDNLAAEAGLDLAWRPELRRFARAVLARWGKSTSLNNIEQYRLQMAAISTAAIGYWKEDDGIHPDYDTPVLRDVAKLYAKYEKLATKES